MVVKTNTRAEGGGMSQEALKEAKAAAKLTDPKNQIWSEKEVNIKAEERADDRPQPEYDII